MRLNQMEAGCFSMNDTESLTTYLPALYGRSHGETYAEVSYSPLSAMRSDREQDWLEYWAKWGTTASSRMIEVALWQAANWREESLALQMLLDWYGQSEDYLFGVEWIAENICVFARKSPETLGGCFDFWTEMPNPMTVNQAVIIALLAQDIEQLSDSDKFAIREKLKNEQLTGHYQFVNEW